jgi:flagellar hook-basal body complex protein FliE
MSITPVIIPVTTGSPYAVQTGGGRDVAPETSRVSTGQATFLDVFSRVMADAVETNQIKDQDMIRLMLGETDHLEQMALNMVKAEIATDLLINVRNAVLDSYNDILRMQL